jgi:hypothetical protein
MEDSKKNLRLDLDGDSDYDSEAPAAEGVERRKGS